MLTNDKKSEVSSQLGPPKPMEFGASSTPGVSHIPNRISAAAIKSANEILLHKRNAKRKGKTSETSSSPAQVALTKLKSFRSDLVNDLKKMSNLNAGAASA